MWELVSRKYGAGGRLLDGIWDKVPAVRIHGTGLAINESACKAFNFNERDFVCIFVDRMRNAIGFKHATETDAYPYQWRRGKAADSKNEERGLRTGCTEAVKMAAAIGAMRKSFELRLNDSDRIVVAVLRPSNDYAIKRSDQSDQTPVSRHSITFG
jgi:hypothetical protein